MKKRVFGALVALLLVTISNGAPGAVGGPPRVMTLEPERLQRARTLVGKGDPETVAALARLRKDAEKALGEGPFSVMDKTKMPPSGDKHDYLTRAPYFWPDPKAKDGLPYIRRDGEVNPDSKVGTDAETVARMAGCVDTLATAYYFTDDERFAERAARLIRVWFLDRETRMNPNFNFAQAIPGTTEGRGFGLIEARNFIRVVEAAGLLEGSKSWTARDREALVDWFKAFVEWMRTSRNGRDEAKAKNNHGSWYDAQLACFALFIGDTEQAKRSVMSARVRIASQIEPDGTQPLELERTKSFEYCMFNLVALTTAAEVGRKLGLDLDGYRTDDGRSLRKALDALAPYADPKKKWPGKQISGIATPRRELAFLLRRAAIVYRDGEYEALLRRHCPEELESSRLPLLWGN